MTIKQALLSVSDKTGLIDFAKGLVDCGVVLLSTGGTAKILIENNIPVTEVSDYTEFPEMMDGRLKTLHPKIHGGLLGRRGVDDKVMAQYNIDAIDLLVVNLYPFAQTITNPNVEFSNVIENIDIGGPTMLRAAAKNHQSVTAVVDPEDYPTILSKIQKNQTVDDDTKFQLAVKTFTHTAQYDGTIANYLSTLNEQKKQDKFPNILNLQFSKKQTMRYGENPHQKAAFYSENNNNISVANATQIQGKELSYNNMADADAAFECVKEFSDCACVIVKHANPCGVAVRKSVFDAYEAAFKTDPTSAFGGIIAFNCTLDAITCKAIINQQFVEVIIAPEITKDAKLILSTKTNIRVLKSGIITDNNEWLEYKRINGGLLVQDRDLSITNKSDLKIVTKLAPTDTQMEDLLFVWQVAKYVKSNAIVYGKNKQTIGIGAGQMSRVYSAKIAAIKAQDENLQITGSVMASDAFFPFRDGLDSAHKAGISAVIQPGGSIRDNEVISAADEHGIAMVFTGTRHFRH